MDAQTKIRCNPMAERPLTAASCRWTNSAASASVRKGFFREFLGPFQRCERGEAPDALKIWPSVSMRGIPLGGTIAAGDPVGPANPRSR